MACRERQAVTAAQVSRCVAWHLKARQVGPALSLADEPWESCCSELLQAAQLYSV
jgi:hypothetical protein